LRAESSWLSPSLGAGPSEIGVEEPMLVPSAIAAMSAAIVMNAPADAARAPAGPTQITMGMGEFKIAVTMSLVDSNSPPGVSRRITKSDAPSRCASVMTRSRKSFVMGLIELSSSA
jgi:hypothetical protein